MKEYWNNVTGYEGLYEVSNIGNVRSLDRRVKRLNHTIFKKGLVLKQGINRHGYSLVYLSKGNTSKTIKVHRLVAIAFLIPSEKPKVNHINGIKTDNRIENIEWSTQKENVHHAMRMGLFNTKGSNCGMSKLVEEEIPMIRGLNPQFNSREIGEMFGVSTSTITSILNYKTWTHA